MNCVCLVCIVSQNWQVGQIHSHCEYSPDVADGIDANIGMFIGLKSVNITLHATRR